MPGLLINGQLYRVPGVTVIGPHETKWAHLNAGDGRPRTRQPTQWMLHKTIADDPERVIPGAGPPGGAERTAEYWEGDPKHSGAHLVTGDDGVVACLADLALFEAYHATVSNPFAVGHETRERVGGGCFQAAYDATIATVLTGIEILGIQFQFPKLPYKGHPLNRMLDGGRNCVGVFGHRDNTEQRGRWDPGDILFAMLAAKGAEAFDFAAGEDLEVWKQRQTELNKSGHKLVVDGVPGAKTTAALKAEGYRGGIWAFGKTSETA